jgi:uncharacterized membrane protein YcaP (DUF421 family)
MHLSDIWHLAISPLSLALRTIGVYFAMLLGFRIFGKRELGQATIFDVAMVLLIANAVQNAMVGPDTSLAGGLIVAAVLLLLNALMAYLQVHDRWFRYVLEGRPTVLVSDGQWFDKALHEEGLDHGEVYAAMRETGIIDVKDVRLAVLEANGNITVVPGDAKTHTIQGSSANSHKNRRAGNGAIGRGR